MRTTFLKRMFGIAAGRHDGPGVIGGITSKDDLERDPRLHGRLEPPGVSIRIDPSSGMRIMSINIHMAVPDGLDLAARNENISALRDIAHFINETNPDVVMVQELRNRPVRPDAEGLSDAASAFAHLMNATQMAFTPAITGEPNFSHYGTAIYTRNGFIIERAVNVALPNDEADSGIEPRSAGIAAVSSPDGHERVTVISTHLAHRPVEDAPLRKKQLRALAAIAMKIRFKGSFTYEGALGGGKQKARRFPRKIILGGDLNQTQMPSDAILKKWGMAHMNDSLADKTAADIPTAIDVPTGRHHRIDHLYGWGIRVLNVAVAAIPGREYTGGAPTDHKAVIADIQVRRRGIRLPGPKA